VGRRERPEPGFDAPAVLGMRGVNFELEKGDSLFHHDGASLPMQHRQNNNVAGFDPVIILYGFKMCVLTPLYSAGCTSGFFCMN
jgi:hypothetical protein